MSQLFSGKDKPKQTKGTVLLVYGATFCMENLYYFTTCSLVNFTVPLL